MGRPPSLLFGVWLLALGCESGDARPVPAVTPRTEDTAQPVATGAESSKVAAHDPPRDAPPEPVPAGPRGVGEPPASAGAPTAEAHVPDVVRGVDGFGHARGGEGELVVRWQAEGPCAEGGDPARVDVDLDAWSIDIRLRPDRGHRCLPRRERFRTTILGLPRGVYRLHAPGFETQAVRVAAGKSRPLQVRTVELAPPRAERRPNPKPAPAPRPAPRPRVFHDPVPDRDSF